MRSRLRRRYRILLWTSAGLLGVLLCAGLSLHWAINSASGRQWLEQASERWSDGGVRITGLSGSLPGQLQLQRLELRDKAGLWLAADEVQLRWSPWQLLWRTVHVDSLQAARVAMERAPSYGHAGKSGSSAMPGHLHIRLDALLIARLDLSADLAGNAVGLQIHGSGSWASLRNASLQFQALRLDGQPATYKASAQFNAARVQGQLDVEEAADGPLGHLAQLPGLGALSIHLRLNGPRAAVTATLAASAGTLQAQAQGRVNLRSGAASIALSLDAQAMAPRPDVAWQSLQLKGQWEGPIDKPQAAAQVKVTGLALPSVHLQSLTAQLQGERGSLQLDAKSGGIVLPGEFASLPGEGVLSLQARMRLDQPAYPIEFSLSHPSISATGRWSGGISAGVGSITARVEDLKPFAALAALDVSGRGTLEAQVRTRTDSARIELSSSLAVTGGQWPLAALLEPMATVNGAMRFDARGFEIERAQLNAGATQVSARGALKDDVFDLHWTAGVADLRPLSPHLAGSAKGSGQLQGRSPRLTLAADMSGELKVDGLPSGALRLSLRARGLPAEPSADLQCSGTLDGAPIEFDASVLQDPHGALAATIRRAQWRSAEASGELQLPRDAGALSGHVSLRMAHVEDLDRLLDQPLQGSFDARLDLDGAAPGGRAQLTLSAKDLGLSAQRLQTLQVSGSVAALSTQPVVSLELAAQGLIGAVPISLQGRAAGPLGALGLQLTASSQGNASTGAQVKLAATLDAGHRALQLRTLVAQYQGQTLQLSAPAQLSFAQGISAQGVHLALAGGGHVDVEAQLQGGEAGPTGTLSFKASALRGASGPARALPALDIDAGAQLQGNVAQLKLQVQSGPRLHFEASGQAPLNSSAPIALQLNGELDLALANPVLEASGQRLLGEAHLAAAVSGTLAAPKAQGTLTLSKADLQDYPRGLHLSAISATLAADGDHVQLQQLSARAGSGTVSANGSVGLGADMPVDIKVQASAAQTLTSDLITASVDTRLTLGGALRRSLNIGGSLHIIRADINIPSAFPPDVAVLDVRRAGRQVTPREDTTLERINLDVAVDAPRAVFVRGRGLNAEVGGTLHVGGTVADPDISGGFDLRNGSVAVAGANLQFTSGQLSFNGTGVHKRIDPSLDFTAEKTINGIDAKLNVGGFADAPTITLSSTPEQTQDQILSMILFGVQPAQLSTLQIAQIAAALASMTTGLGNGFSPLSAVQRKLRLDRLAISGSSTPGSGSTTPNVPGAVAASNNTAATIEAGRYISRRVFVGAKQTTNGSSQAEVQVDLTTHLKVDTVLGTGGGTLQGATPQNDPGSSVGLSFQLEY